jgi:twitching motility two-component system response regulator PilG
MNNPGTFTELSPQQLLRQVTNCSDSTCLQAFSNSVFWSIYINQGKIVYATHSVEPFDRLERHLRRLRPNSLLLTSEIRGELRLLFDPDCQTQLRERPDNSLTRLPEYQAINWLINEQLLVSTQVARLVQAVSQEVIESFLLIKQGTYEFKELGNDIDIICQLDTDNVLEYCQNRLQIWQSFTPEITSPYQRPYLLINSKFYHQQLPELQENLTSWMKGFSLRHLAVIMDQDELELAQTLYPHTLRGTIILHESDPPYDKLPKILTNSPAAPQ